MSVEIGWIVPLQRWVARSSRGVFVLSSSPALRRLDKRRRYRGVVLG